MKIYPLTARIPIKIGEVVFHVSPLSYQGKLELAQYIVRRGGADLRPDLQYFMKCLQLCLKKVEGAEYFDGKQFELTFDHQGFVSDDSLGEVSQILSSAKAAAATASLIGEMQDPKMDGVEVNFDKVYLEDSKKKS